MCSSDLCAVPTPLLPAVDAVQAAATSAQWRLQRSPPAWGVTSPRRARPPLTPAPTAINPPASLPPASTPPWPPIKDPAEPSPSTTPTAPNRAAAPRPSPQLAAPPLALPPPATAEPPSPCSTARIKVGGWRPYGLLMLPPLSPSTIVAQGHRPSTSAAVGRRPPWPGRPEPPLAELRLGIGPQCRPAPFPPS